MGQKVNPIAFRLAVNKDWRSKWFAKGKDYTDKLHEDLAIRGYLKNKLINAGLAQSKHRSGLLWWLFSLVLGPIATFLIVVLPNGAPSID